MKRETLIKKLIDIVDGDKIVKLIDAILAQEDLDEPLKVKCKEILLREIPPFKLELVKGYEFLTDEDLELMLKLNNREGFVERYVKFLMFSQNKNKEFAMKVVELMVKEGEEIDGSTKGIYNKNTTSTTL